MNPPYVWWSDIRFAMLFQTSFYDWMDAHLQSQLPSFYMQCTGLDRLILNSVTVCVATDKCNQFAVVRRRQTCFASIYCTSPIFVTFLVFPITSKFITFIQKNHVCLYYSKFPCQLQTYNTNTGTLTVTVQFANQETPYQATIVSADQSPLPRL